MRHIRLPWREPAPVVIDVGAEGLAGCSISVRCIARRRRTLVAVTTVDRRSDGEAWPTASVLKLDWAQLLKTTISLPDGSVGST